MLILNTESCPQVSISNDRIFVKLKTRNPSSGRLVDAAGFFMTPNESLWFYQRLLKATIEVIEASRHAYVVAETIFPFETKSS